MNSNYHRNRFLLLCGAIVGAVVFWYLGAWFRIPEFRGYDVCLLMQPSPIGTMLVVAIALCAVVTVCSLISGAVRADAGLFCTALGLMALSLRGGPMRYTLFESRQSPFLAMALELVALYAIFGLGWLIIRFLFGLGLTRPDDRDFMTDNLPFDQKIFSTAIQAVATATLVLTLCRTDQKVQCLAAVGLASLVGSMLAVISSPTRPSVWFWTGPLFAGLLGYLWSARYGLQNVPIGQVSGYFSALARPLPIDYASAGVAGSMLGYWFGQSWTIANEEEPEEESPTHSTNPPAERGTQPT